MVNFIFIAMVILCLPAAGAKALNGESMEVEFAKAFNGSCTGAVSQSTLSTYGQSNLPEPLKIEGLLKQAIRELLGMKESQDDPSFSTLQTNLQLLNVSTSRNCAEVQWNLEQEFYVYGLKAWIERAGAASYLLIRRGSGEPQMIELRSYFTW